MATPRRHGMRWNTIPTPLSDGAPATAIGGSLTPLEQPRQALPTLTTRELDAFLNSLPRESLAFISKSQEIRYDHSLNIGGQLTIAQLSVPKSYYWVINDVEFYAYGPTVGLGTVPTQLEPGALVGLFRLDFLIGGSSPLQSQSWRMSPYAEPSQAAATTSGWPWLQKAFGSQRMPSFALYAGENESIDLMLTVENVPRFPITKVGFNFHGFAVPVLEFSKIWVQKV